MKCKYNGKREKIKIDNKEYDAFFPNRHSRVKGIIYSYNRWNVNSKDSYANIPFIKEHIRLYVLWKGEKEWEKIIDGNKNNSSYSTYYPLNNPPDSYAYLLKQMETKSKQEKIRLKEREKELKNKIKEYNKELKEVVKKILMMK